MNRKETWAKLVLLGGAKGIIPDASWELGCVNLAGAELVGADLFESHLDRADLVGANLSYANLSFVDLYRANLVGANLSHANLSEANLVGAKLMRAELSAANFKKADLKNADLREAVVADANFSQADLSNSDITASVVSNVLTSGWIIDGIKASFIYFCHFNEEDKEKYRRNFEKGQFEVLFKCFPMVELIFEERLSVQKLLVLMGLIEKQRWQFPDLGIGLEHIIEGKFRTRVGIRVNQHVSLGKAAEVIRDGVTKYTCGASHEALAPLLSDVLVRDSSETRNKTPDIGPPSTVRNAASPTFQLIKADRTPFT